MKFPGSTISTFRVSAYTVPTDMPEADGTLAWTSTTLVLVELEGAGHTGLGYTYGHESVVTLLLDKLEELVIGKDFLQIPSLHAAMIAQVRNVGLPGIASMAVSAVDIALWDLKSKFFGVPLATLLGMVRNRIPVYGSGGFTSYDEAQTAQQFGRWADEGIRSMKMKVGSHPGEDVRRVKQARDILGNDCALFVDANGAYHAKQALRLAEEFGAYGVTWFEEPVSSDDLAGLRFVRDHTSMDVTAGEYGYHPDYFMRMIEAEAVDILQADVTRCGGISSWLKIGHLCEANHILFTSHCAPALHLHAALCMPSFYMAEYFHDHVRIENEFFDGVARPVNGYLAPDPAAPGLGIRLKKQAVEKYKIM